MKGGSFRRWYGNQDYCLNYGLNGFELKAWAAPLYGNSGWSRIIKSPDFYFRSGVTYSYLTSGQFNARLSPGGFIFDVAGSSLFPADVPLVLALMNSTFAAYALRLINPTVNFQVGDIARIPVPHRSSAEISRLVEQALTSAKADSEEDETTYDFVFPSPWPDGIDDIAGRKAKLSEIERAIDEEVYRLYGICAEDRTAIEAELEGSPARHEDAENAGTESEDGKESADSDSLTREKLALQWFSYAVGIVMGRFVPGEEGELGRGSFSHEVAARLRKLVDADGIVTLDSDHPDDLAARVMSALEIMLGPSDAIDLVRTALGNGSDRVELLRRYLERDFFKQHIQQYRKRPVYWLLQSPAKSFSTYIFHERMTKDTLFRIQREAGDKVRLIETRMTDLRRKRDASEGREQRKLEKAIAEMADVLDDVREFARRIQLVLDRGYQPHIDDGVLLNMAPLWELIPAWPAEPKKAWEALERGDYDWSHQAMDHWPDRVREQCLTNKSYAIAHGLDTQHAKT